VRLSSEQRGRIERLINTVMDKTSIGRDEVVEVLHKYVCEGSCDWYKRNSRKDGFDRLSIRDEQRATIEESVNQVMLGLTIDEAKRRIHVYICKR